MCVYIYIYIYKHIYTHTMYIHTHKLYIYIVLIKILTKYFQGFSQTFGSGNNNSLNSRTLPGAKRSSGFELVTMNWPAASPHAPPGHAEAAARQGERGEAVAEAGLRQAAVPGPAPRPAAHALQTGLREPERQEETAGHRGPCCSSKHFIRRKQNQRPQRA